MTLATEPVIKQSRHDASPRTAREWLDALASGACDQDAFYTGVGVLLKNSPDSVWELLAYVDQYYRRGKLSADAFGTLKAHLQSVLVGKDTSVPWPRLQDEPAGAVAPTAATTTAFATTTAVAPTAATTTAFAATPAAPTAAARAAAASAVSAASATTVLRMSAAHAPHAAAAPAADEHAARPPRSLAVGDVLRGRYQIQGLLGRGGMGTVFAATDQYRLDRSHGDQRVAIKVLHTEVIKRPRLFAELRREFQHLQSLSHPNIVRVHEFDRDGDLAFFSMEYLRGEMLSRVLAVADATALHRPYALAIIRDVGAAIAHAHARGVVHGDLNPGNIFVTDGGEIRVLDFGASHQLHSAPWISEFDQHQQIAVATPSYASCQVLEGEAADARDDVYALACVAYKLLTGNHPFHDDTALKARTLRLSPARPEGLTRQQWSTLREGLHFDRERRPGDVHSWLDRLDLRAAAVRLPELQSLWLPRPRRRHPLEWGAAGIATALIMAGAWFALTHHDEVDRGAAALGAQIKSMLAHPAPIRLRGDAAIAASAATNPPAAPSSAQVDIPPAAPAAVQATAFTAPATSSVAASSASAAAPVAPAPAPAPATAAAQVAAPAPVPAPPTAPVAASATAPGVAPAPAVAASGPGGIGPRARIELAADSVDVPPTEDMARIVVRRSRTLRDDVSFTWWTESGTAKPGVDFVPVKSTVERIEKGENAVSLAVPLIADPARHASRSFYVVIDDASDNAALGPRTLTMITLPGSD
jgi:hypothetical protein